MIRGFNVNVNRFIQTLPQTVYFHPFLTMNATFNHRYPPHDLNHRRIPHNNPYAHVCTPNPGYPIAAYYTQHNNCHDEKKKEDACNPNTN
jgi:hypothetical protein